jgi:hypothetical protein
LTFLASPGGRPFSELCIVCLTTNNAGALRSIGPHRASSRDTGATRSRMQIAAGGRDIGVAARVQWGRLLDGMRAVGVPQPMRIDRRVDRSPCRSPLQHR